jgi:hypothetical protein
MAREARWSGPERSVTFAGEGRPRLALVHCGSIIDGVLLKVGGESGRRFRGEGGSTRGGLVCM